MIGAVMRCACKYARLSRSMTTKLLAHLNNPNRTINKQKDIQCFAIIFVELIFFHLDILYIATY